MWAETAGVALAAGASLLGYAISNPNSQLLGPCISRIETEQPIVCLTFDDGPSPWTLPVLDILEAHNIRATFFQCGVNVRRYPEIARRVVECGHEVGNHTDSHPYLLFRSQQFLREELYRAHYSIQEATGCTPRFFRPPFGVRWFGLTAVERELGLVQVTWTVIGKDWKLTADEIVRHVLRRVRNGAIICLHDGREIEPEPNCRETVLAVRKLVLALPAMGFHFCCLGEALCLRN